MNIGERVAALRPYLWGGVLGAIVITIVGFSAGWVVTAGTLDESLSEQKVRLLATVCADDVKESWQGQVPEKLTGWENREKREEMAKKFAPVASGEKEPNSEVIDECAEQIDAMAEAAA